MQGKTLLLICADEQIDTSAHTGPSAQLTGSHTNVATNVKRTLKLNQNKQQPYSHSSLQQDVLSKTNMLVSPWSVHLFTLVAWQNCTAQTSPPLVTKTQKNTTHQTHWLSYRCTLIQFVVRVKWWVWGVNPAAFLILGDFVFFNVKSMKVARTCRLLSSSQSFTLKSNYVVTCQFEHIVAP